MKQLLLTIVVVIAMAGISNAQQTCGTNADCGPGYTSCDTSITGGRTGMCLTLSNDPLNCGHPGVECGEAYDCRGGSCTCIYIDQCNGGGGWNVAPEQNSVQPRPPVALRLRHDDVTAAVREMRRAGS